MSSTSARMASETMVSAIETGTGRINPRTANLDDQREFLRAIDVCSGSDLDFIGLHLREHRKASIRFDHFSNGGMLATYDSVESDADYRERLVDRVCTCRGGVHVLGRDSTHWPMCQCKAERVGQISDYVQITISVDTAGKSLEDFAAEIVRQMHVSAHADPLDEVIDGFSLRTLLAIDEEYRQDRGCSPYPPSRFTPAQRLVVSAHWSAQLRAKIASAPKPGPQVVLDCAEEL